MTSEGDNNYTRNIVNIITNKVKISPLIGRLDTIPRKCVHDLWNMRKHRMCLKCVCVRSHGAFFNSSQAIIEVRWGPWGLF